MSEGRALLAAVIAAPEDDAVPLVYADWLDEHGDAPRAELIRVQIERERLPQGDPKRDALAGRERELLGRHAKRWLHHLPKWAWPSDHELVATEWDWFGFKRGFLQGVATGTGKAFLRGAAKIFAAEPVTHLYLGDVDEKGMARLARSPEFMRLIGLRFGHYVLGYDGVIALCELPPMPRLRQLWLYKNEIGDSGLKALAKWPGLATVEDLELGFNDFHAPGIKALIASPHLTRVKRLDLSDSLIAATTKQALRKRFGRAVEV